MRVCVRAPDAIVEQALKVAFGCMFRVQGIWKGGWICVWWKGGGLEIRGGGDSGDRGGWVGLEKGRRGRVAVVEG